MFKIRTCICIAHLAICLKDTGRDLACTPEALGYHSRESLSIRIGPAPSVVGQTMSFLNTLTSTSKHYAVSEEVVPSAQQNTRSTVEVCHLAKSLPRPVHCTTVSYLARQASTTVLTVSKALIHHPALSTQMDQKGVTLVKCDPAQILGRMDTTRATIKQQTMFRPGKTMPSALSMVQEVIPAGTPGPDMSKSTLTRTAGSMADMQVQYVRE